MSKEWAKALFERHSEVVEVGFMSDGEKMGYLLAMSNEDPDVPGGLGLKTRLEAIREHYCDNHMEASG